MALWQEILLATPYALTTIITITLCTVFSFQAKTVDFKGAILQLLWFTPVLAGSIVSSVLVPGLDSAIIFLKVVSFILPIAGYFVTVSVLYHNRNELYAERKEDQSKSLAEAAQKETDKKRSTQTHSSTGVSDETDTVCQFSSGTEESDGQIKREECE